MLECKTCRPRFSLRTISFARRSSLFSRSSVLMRCASTVVIPGRAPASTSARLTHSSSVCGTQPIFGAIDSTAAHSDGYAPRCFWTIRTARSRTSGENLFDLFMASFSQVLKPPQNPGRFNRGNRIKPGRRLIQVLNARFDNNSQNPGRFSIQLGRQQSWRRLMQTFGHKKHERRRRV